VRLKRMESGEKVVGGSKNRKERGRTRRCGRGEGRGTESGG